MVIEQTYEITNLFKVITYECLLLVKNTELYNRLLLCDSHLTNFEFEFDDFNNKLSECGIHKIEVLYNVSYSIRKHYQVIYSIDTKFLVIGLEELLKKFNYSVRTLNQFKLLWNEMMETDIFFNLDDIEFKYKITTNDFKLGMESKIDYRLLRESALLTTKVSRNLYNYSFHIDLRNGISGNGFRIQNGLMREDSTIFMKLLDSGITLYPVEYPYLFDGGCVTSLIIETHNSFRSLRNTLDKLLSNHYRLSSFKYILSSDMELLKKAEVKRILNLILKVVESHYEHDIEFNIDFFIKGDIVEKCIDDGDIMNILDKLEKYHINILPL